MAEERGASTVVPDPSITNAALQQAASTRVIIVGAGPAGMTATHQLRQLGVNVSVYEASGRIGGRIRHDTGFTDFPIALGGEWIHVGVDILDEIVNDPGIDVATPTRGYAPNDTVGRFNGRRLKTARIGRAFADRVFVNGSWFEFFERLILPGIRDRIELNAAVTVVDSRGSDVQLHLADGRIESADHVIVTAPLQMLKDDTIEFLPRLSNRALRAVDRARVWSGFKAFFEFSDAFYPTFLEFRDSETARGQRVYYDAAYGRNTEANVLGLFAVGKQAEQYQRLDDNQLRAYVLAELDRVFKGQATPRYIRHISQDWGAEPYIRQAYLADVARVSTSRQLFQARTNKVLFAGDAYTLQNDWGSVHMAARSARDAVKRIGALVAGKAAAPLSL
ncbi:MAG: NAD(P)/FAD-dependent oxidoreductase [Pseudomonadota bacterium]